MSFAAAKAIADSYKSGLSYSAQAESSSDVFQAAVENLVSAGLEDILYTPARQHDNYGARIDSYWSATSRSRPWAILQPRNTAEVSKAITALVQTDNYGVIVAGGREGLVGVGGLLTGGGMTYYTCRVGFACDQVVNYEIVLADGTVTNANESVNPDLFRVLKGGSNNFGIVTRFDMVTFPAHDVYDGIITLPMTAEDAVIDAFIDFTKQLHLVPDAHIIAMWSSVPQRDIDFLNGVTRDPNQPPDLTMVSTINMIMTQLDGVENSPSLQKFIDIPNRISSTMNHGSVAKKVAGVLMASNGDNIWFSLVYTLDKRILEKSSQIYRKIVFYLGNRAPGCVVHMFLLPLPTAYGQHSLARGGNMLGLERLKDDSDAVQDLESYAKEVRGDVDFRYLNYCDGSQDPLAGYGAENIRKMKDAAAKYDPNGVFQTRVPGGFKISKVKSP
ncbi:hypothetical protein LQW54_002324 [Pestalotiopsis sp. IQ-011]